MCIRDRPSTHSYLGPILWSPAVALPPWWDDLPTDRPVIYATMGSSGRPDLLELVLKALADLPVTVVATTAAKPLQAAPPNARLIDYAPGDQLAARADMMICNGGSLTVYQSLAAGKPLLGIASHMDQHLSMSYVEKAGVGTLLRSEELTSTKLRETVHQLLANDLARRRAQDLATSIAAYAPAERLGKILEEITARVQH